MQGNSPRSRVRRKKSLANLLLAIPAFVVMGFITIGLFWLIRLIQLARCPTETFLVGSGQIATIFQIIPLLIASVGLGFLTTNWIAHAVKPLRRYFDRNAELHHEPRYRSAQSTLITASAAIAALTLPISFTASFSQFCLAQDGIAYQPWLLSGLVRHPWTDVGEIKTSCSRSSKGGWSGSYEVILRDGEHLDILAWPNEVIRAYPAMSKALEHVPLTFDSAGVDLNCNAPFADILVRRP